MNQRAAGCRTEPLKATGSRGNMGTSCPRAGKHISVQELGKRPLGRLQNRLPRFNSGRGLQHFLSGTPSASVVRFRFQSRSGFVIGNGACAKLGKFPGSSVVEQPAVNRLVAGSNPARGANTYSLLFATVRHRAKNRCATNAFAPQLFSAARSAGGISGRETRLRQTADAEVVNREQATA
jgi:hypothetical protein